MSSAPVRIPALDALRGFALFGILIVNAPFFLTPEGSFGNYSALTFPGWQNRAAEFLSAWLFDGKFILIFSFLFGWGLHTQMGRGAEFKARYLRRLLGLFLIGLAHAIFLFVGDILVTYAVLGLPLYLMRDWQVRKLVVTAIALWALSVATQGILGALLALLQSMQLPEYQALIALHQTGSFLEIVVQRVGELAELYAITPFLFMPEVMGMFLLGLAAAKTYGETGIKPAKLLAQKLLNFLLLPALLGNGLYAAAAAYPNTFPLGEAAGLALHGAFVPMLTLVYLSAAAILLDRSFTARIADLLGGEGRMSLSIYIGQSAIMGFVALSYGLALYGKISPSLSIALCVGVYLALLVFANLWMRVFHIGPCEWLLRSITEGRFVRMLRN